MRQRRRSIHLALPSAPRTLCGRPSKAHLPHHRSWERCKSCAKAARKLGPWHSFSYYTPGGWSIPSQVQNTSTSATQVLVRWAQAAA